MVREASPPNVNDPEHWLGLIEDSFDGDGERTELRMDLDVLPIREPVVQVMITRAREAGYLVRRLGHMIVVRKVSRIRSVTD